MPANLTPSPPVRIQRKRVKGAHMPQGTVYVGRGTRWGNPFVIGKDGTAGECVRKYADMIAPYRHHGPNSGLEKFYISTANMEDIKRELAGKNLACWCPLDQPCHADVLLEIANG
jgi:hypothetical protein